MVDQLCGAQYATNSARLLLHNTCPATTFTNIPARSPPTAVHQLHAVHVPECHRHLQQGGQDGEHVDAGGLPGDDQAEGATVDGLI
jgi:hypothetical protein